MHSLTTHSPTGTLAIWPSTTKEPRQDQGLGNRVSRIGFRGQVVGDRVS